MAYVTAECLGGFSPYVGSLFYCPFNCQLFIEILDDPGVNKRHKKLIFLRNRRLTITTTDLEVEESLDSIVGIDRQESAFRIQTEKMFLKFSCEEMKVLEFEV